MNEDVTLDQLDLFTYWLTPSRNALPLVRNEADFRHRKYLLLTLCGDKIKREMLVQSKLKRLAG